MITTISGISADTVWQNAVECFNNGKDVYIQSSRSGSTEELLHVGLTIENPRQRWVVSRYPAINPAFALAEVAWIMNGSREAKILNHWNPILPKFAGDGEYYHGAYGYRLRTLFGFDQLEKAYNILCNNPDTRQVVLQIWNAENDLPHNDGSPAATDIPCNVCSILKIRESKLEWLQIIRSNDLFLGVPHNFVQFTYLQEIIAGWLNLEVGSYNQISDSLHIYENDRNNIDQYQPINAEVNTDLLYKAKSESDSLFCETFRRMRIMATENVSRKDFFEAAVLETSETAYQNMLCVIASDSARRKGWKDMVEELMSRCTNPSLKQVWERWSNRVEEKSFMEASK